MSSLTARTTRALYALAAMFTVALLAGCDGASVDPGKAPGPGDVANKGAEGFNKGADKGTELALTYPKFIAGLIVFGVVAFFVKRIFGNKHVAMVVAFIAGCLVIAMSSKK